MQVVFHRRNTISELKAITSDLGVEVDIRSFGKRLIINHDPYKESIDFEDWLIHYNHKLLILNVKEEGLEERLLILMNKYNIENFFFLDQSFPLIIKTISNGESRTCIRVSEYESIETAIKLSGKAKWVWVDFFNYFPLDYESFLKLKEAKFKLCLVSPELQGHPYSKVDSLKNQLKKMEINFDAVCTKDPNLWRG
mgnify:CR=1 FL=1|tara:strand:+ start:882 stop:1469 length:588 start_codon:yes stop_codon:yes gene_type:complete